jgi:hypothetical protein
MVKRLFVGLLFACLGFTFAAAPALAGELDAADFPVAEKQNLHWRCWYDQQIHIHCLLDTEIADSKPAGYEAAINLPKVVRELRSNPSRFRAVLVRIPMFTDPLEHGFARDLAQASMCGGRGNCSVHYSGSVPHHEEIAELMLRQMDWAAREKALTAQIAASEAPVRVAAR